MRPDQSRIERDANVDLVVGAGLHTVDGEPLDASAYWQYIGRWSRLFVPALLAVAEVGEGDRVLDVATGTGEAARQLSRVVGDPGVVIGADVSMEMLTAASIRLPSAGFAPVAADAQRLPFADACFDAVVCQLGLMFLSDPAKGLAECRRVVRRGRCVAACVISSPSRAPMWSMLADALSRCLPRQRDVLSMSFSLADPARLERLFHAAGLEDVRINREVRTDVVGSFDEYWSPIEAGAGQLPNAYLTLAPSERRRVRAEVREGLSPFETDGHYELSVEMLIGSGRASR